MKRMVLGSKAKKNISIYELAKMAYVWEKIRMISLVENSSIDYSLDDNGKEKIIGQCCDANEQMENFVDEYVGVKYRPQMRAFCDLSTLEDRMFSSKVLEKDFITTDGMWDRVMLIVIEEDSKGFPTKIAFTLKRIADQYYIKALGLDINRIP